MYAIYYKTQLSTENIFDLDDEMLNKVIDSYNKGLDKFTLKGKVIHFSILFELKIFKIEDELNYRKVIQNPGAYTRNFTSRYISPDLLSKVGIDITYESIGNNEFGYLQQEKIRGSNYLTHNNESDLEISDSVIDILNTLIDKKAFLEKELITTYDSEKKFALQEQIKELEKQIEKIRKNL